MAQKALVPVLRAGRAGFWLSMMRAQKNSSPYFHEVEAKAYVAMLVSFESDLLNIMHDAFLLYSHDLNQRSATYLALTEAFDNILRISVQAYAGEIEDFDSNVSWFYDATTCDSLTPKIATICGITQIDVRLINSFPGSDAATEAYTDFCLEYIKVWTTADCGVVSICDTEDL